MITSSRHATTGVVLFWKKEQLLCFSLKILKGQLTNIQCLRTATPKYSEKWCVCSRRNYCFMWVWKYKCIAK